MKITLGSIFCFLLICNILLMPISDDFWHQRLSVSGFQSAITAYMGWNGRIGELLISSYIPHLNRYVFDVLNSLVGVGFIFSFFILIFGRIPKDKLDSLTLILFVALTISFTAFGSVYLWESGALNYLWGYFFIVLSLLPYRIFWQRRYENVKPKRDKFAVLKALGMMIACIVAGWSSEQMGIITLIVHVVFLILARIKKIPLPLWYYTGIIGFLLGWLMLYFSPGTAKRASADFFNGTYLGLGDILDLGWYGIVERVFKAMGFRSFLSKVFIAYWTILLYIRFIKFPRGVWKNMIWILGFIATAVVMLLLGNIPTMNMLVYGFLFWFVYKSRMIKMVGSTDFWVLMLFSLYVLCALSTIQMLWIPDRAKYGSDLLLMGMIALFFRDVYVRSKAKKWIGHVLVFCSIFMGIFVIVAYANYNYKWNQVVVYIEKQKAAGNMDIVVPSSTFSSFYPWIGDWPMPVNNVGGLANVDYAKHFGIRSLKAEE